MILQNKLIKSCKGVRRCNNGINRMQKEGSGEDFRIISGFK